ncbi:MAG: adenylate/guanylate cyclase domain-containing protein [Pseudomonadota bacterium]|nr:adenylate/guanylate cyclase domain-containing protein [Pseudomonadota bacterium]
MKKLSRFAQRFGIGRALCLMLLFVLVLLRVWDPVPVEELRLRTFDFYQMIQPRTSAHRPVVIVDIDEESLKAYGQWPWPRTLVADLVTRLGKLGSVAVAFDIIFPEPDRVSPDMAVRGFRGLDDETLERLRRMPSNDKILADAFGNVKVVVGQSGLRGTSLQPGGKAPLQTGFATLGEDPSPYLVTFPGLLRNLAVLEDAAAGRGLFTIRPERDGIVRRVPVVMKADGVMVPSLTLELLRVVTQSGAILIRTDAAGIQSVAVPGLEVPTDQYGQLWIHFSPRDPARYISAKDVLDGRVSRDKVAGKLVLIGTSAVGLLDLKATPVEPSMPGVEVHAQILENVLSGSVLLSPSFAVVAELGITILISLAMIGLAPVLGAWTLFVSGAGVAAALVGMSWYSYINFGILFDFTFVLISTFLIYLTLVFTNYLKSQSERQWIRSAFSQYLSPALVEQLAQSRDRLVLGGEKREMTVMFSDVRNFTTISELYKDDPQGLTSLMNRFLTPLTNAIIDRKGTIDKYMGDAIMAFWNAPLHDPSHQANACEAALQMLERLRDLNAELEREARANDRPFVPLNIGVGINTGTCVVGNMGSDLHFNYSVLGDAVNLASRLEGQCKSYGVPIVIGSKTAHAVQGSFALLELDFIAVKGKTEPQLVYTILGRKEVAETARFKTLYECNSTMLSCYRKRDWQGALTAIEQCRSTGDGLGLDRFYDLYVRRIRSYQENPPLEDWNGVFAAEAK